MHWLLGLNCMTFDLHTMKSYDHHDFGFDLRKPGTSRWLYQNFEDFFFVLPSRAGARKTGEDQGIEVCCGLEETVGEGSRLCAICRAQGGLVCLMCHSTCCCELPVRSAKSRLAKHVILRLWLVPFGYSPING